MLCHCQGKKSGLTSKLQPTYEGPYRIIEISYPNIRIETMDGEENEKIHVNRTKPYYTESHGKRVRFNDNVTIAEFDKADGQAQATNKETTIQPTAAADASTKYNLRSRTRAFV